MRRKSLFAVMVLCLMLVCLNAQALKPDFWRIMSLGHPLSYGMQVCWIMNQGTGDYLYDESWQWNSGTIVGATWVPGDQGYALSFDGTNDYGDVSYISGMTDWSVHVRYKPDSVSGRYPILDQGDILIYQQDDDIIWGFTDDNYTDRTSIAAAVLGTDTWVNLLATKYGNSHALYIDGLSTDTLSDSSTPLTALAGLLMAKDSRASIVYPDLTIPAGEKGLLITASDLFEYGIGSASLDSSTVTENWNGEQLTIVAGIESLNFVPGDGLTHYILDNQGTSATENRVRLFIDTAGLLTFVVHDKDSTQHLVGYDITGWAVGSSHLIVAVVDFKNDAIELYTDGVSRDSTPDNALSSDSIDTVEANIHFGKDTLDANQLNGIATLQLFNRAWTDAEVAADFASGAVDVVCPDTILLGNYSDDTTSASYWPFGQSVTATTASQVTLAEAVGLRSWADNDLCNVSDGTGYSVDALINEAGGILAADTTLELDNISPAELAQVGVSADLDGDSQCFYRDDTDFPESGITGANDLTIQLWLLPRSFIGAQYIVTKYNMFSFGLSTTHFHLRINATSRITNAALEAGKWSFIAIVYDASAGTGDFYMNGQWVEQEVGFPTSISDLASVFSVGSICTGGTNFVNFSNIKLANFALFDDKRTAGEILASALDRSIDLSGEGNIIGQWMFTEAADAAAIDNLESDAGRDLIPYDGGNVTFSALRGQSAFISKSLITDGGMESGGIGAIDTVGSNITPTKDTSVVKYDTQSQKLVWTAADDNDEVVLRSFTGENGGDYWYRFCIYFTSIDGASDFFFDVDGAGNILARQLDTGTDDMGTSYATGTWLMYEGTFSGDQNGTHNLNLRVTGAGAGANAAVIYTDQWAVMVNMVAAGDCEAADGNALPTGWSDTGTPDADETQTDTADFHSGASSILLNLADTDEGVTQIITTIVGEYYTLSWHEKNNAQDIDVVLSDAVAATIDSTGDNTWTKHSYTFKAATTTLTLKLISGAAAQSGWFDDVSLIVLDEAAATSAARTPDYLDGTIDFIKVWNRALSAAEALWEFTNPYAAWRR